MKDFISFIDFTNMSDEEKFKLLNKKDYEIDKYKNIIDEVIGKIEPFVEWGECTINGKILKEIYDKLKGE